MGDTNQKNQRGRCVAKTNVYMHGKMQLYLVVAIWALAWCFVASSSSTGATLKVATSTIFDSEFLQQVRDNNQNIQVKLVDLNTEQYLNYIMSSSTEVDVFSVDI